MPEPLPGGDAGACGLSFRELIFLLPFLFSTMTLFHLGNVMVLVFNGIDLVMDCDDDI